MKHDYEESIQVLKDAIKESEEVNEAKESELVQYRAQVEANDLELSQYKEELTRLEAYKESLQEEINNLNAIHQQELQQLRQQQQTQYGLSSDIGLDLDFNKPQLKKSNSVKSAPRLFCDICDEFDLHDTNDCPQQYSTLAEQKLELETHTKYNAHTTGNSLNRAYCDLCEQFGHDESECPMQNAQQANKVASDEEF